MPLYAAALRPLLFHLSPDRSHALAHMALRWAMPWQVLAAASGLAVADERLRVRFAGVDLPNPVGLAAGFDKDCDLLESLSALGFGHVTVGSIMPQSRFGNPFPRLVRYPETRSLADSMGVPSKGRDHAAARLAAFTRYVPLIANIGGFSAEDLIASFRLVAPHVDAVELSLMCPNAKERKNFDELKLLRETLGGLHEPERARCVVRVPNDTAQADERIAELVEQCIERGVAGLKIGGGRPVAESRLGARQGTLHGKTVFSTALENLKRAASFARGRIPIKGNGGIFSGADVIAMLRAGAVCVDLYSAFIYEGWTIARRINRELVAAMDAAGVGSVSELATQAAGTASA